MYTGLSLARDCLVGGLFVVLVGLMVYLLVSYIDPTVKVWDAIVDFVASVWSFTRMHWAGVLAFLIAFAIFSYLLITSPRGVP